MPLRVACVQTPPPLPSITQATLGQTVKQVRANAETVINDAAGNLKKPADYYVTRETLRLPVFSDSCRYYIFSRNFKHNLISKKRDS